MKRAVRQVAVSALLLLVLCIVCRFVFYRTYTAYFPLYLSSPASPEDFRIESEDPEVATGVIADVLDQSLKITVIPGNAGNTYLDIYNASGVYQGTVPARVTRFHTVYDSSDGGFSGDTVAILAATLFWLLTGAIMLWNFFQAKGPSFYQYRTIWFAGFSLFALITGLCLLEVSIRHLADPASYSMLNVYSALSGASVRFMHLTALPFAAFAAAMAVSNIALLRHQRPRPQNMLGILAGILLAASIGVSLYITSLDFVGSEREYRLHMTFQNTCTTFFVYFECMLAGSVICGLKAARHTPAPDKDFIVILGCWFRKDGSLPPLLRGRVDRAIAFWRMQKELTGKEAVLIPSGGQGPDEPMPEAEAMKRYLLEQGIPEERIRTEDQSRNTLQNMAYSRKIAEEIDPRGKAAFATTNYHVFRSGVWAGEAGLKAEGMGGKTKWWYWPNAFMRECLGLLQKRWKQELIGLILLAAFFGALSRAML